MKKALKIVGIVVAVLVVGAVGFIQTATQVRQLREHPTLTANGKAEKSRTADALDYSVATEIAAPPEIVWAVLTDAKGYTSWNSTIIKLDGDIKLGSKLKLVSKSAPDRTFDIEVTTFDAPRKLIWEDGGKVFMGVRTYSLTPIATGTRFAMSETFSGRMLGAIEPSLPDFTSAFETVAGDLKKEAEKRAPAPPPAPSPTPVRPPGPEDAAPPAH